MQSKCSKCDGTFFELIEKEPRNSNYKYIFVQCTKCGNVVGVVDYFNNGNLLNQVLDKLNNIERKLKIY